MWIDSIVLLHECLQIMKFHLRPFFPFSADGKKLASVGLDDDHSIVVWDWKKGQMLATARGHKDKLFQIKWSPFDENQLVTVGVKHIKFWAQVGKEKSL